MAKQEIFFGINIDTGEAIKDFGTLKRRTKELKAELDGTKVGTKRFEELRTEIRQNQATIRRFNRDLRDTKSLATRVGQGMTNAFKKLGGVLVAAFAVDQLMQYGKQLFDLTKELSKVTNQVEQLTGVTNDNAKAIANQAKALNQVYGVETQEVIKAATALASQFGITFDEALNKINVGFAIGLDNNGEFLEILKEYPAQLASVGLNADQTFAIINQTVTEGVYSDKGIDAIKEAGLRLRELPKATQDALNDIGLSSSTIQRSLENGTSTVFDIIQQVSTRLGELPPQSNKVGKAIADIFGGPGEDAGLRFLKMLGDIDTNFESITANLSEYEQSQLALVEAQSEFNSVLNQFFGESSAGFNKIKANVIELAAQGLKDLLTGLVDIANAFIELYNESSAFRIALATVGEIGKAAFRNLKTGILNAVDGFKVLGGVISDITDGEFGNISNTISDGLSKIAKRSAENAKLTAESFRNAFKDNFTEKDKISLIDFSSEPVQQATKDTAETTATTFAEKFNNTIRKQIKLDLGLGSDDDGFAPASGSNPIEAQIGQISVLEQRLGQLAEVYPRVSDGLINLSNAHRTLASVQKEGSKEQERFTQASIRLAQVEAVANNTVALSEALKGVAKDIGKGFPTNIVAVASTLGLIASTFASVKALSSDLPKLQKGGIISGPSHAEGGVPVKMASGGMVEAEGGEAIINKKNTALFAPVLSAINSYGGNGDKFERGGIVSNGVPNTISTPSVTTSNIIDQLQSINFRPTVSVVEINEAQTRVTEIENSTTL